MITFSETPQVFADKRELQIILIMYCSCLNDFRLLQGRFVGFQKRLVLLTNTCNNYEY